MVNSFSYPNYTIEDQLWGEGYQLVMGLDEVGRGCLAGPVVAAGVILKPGTYIEGITDSKMLNGNERLRMSGIIKKRALSWVIKSGSIDEIERHNILWASLLTMEKCVKDSNPVPDYLLIDGNRYVDTIVPHSCLVKGDQRSASIGAASILAKVYRDDLMKRLHNEYPFYGWISNVGYPTSEHFKGLQKYGYTPHHRLGFKLRTNKRYKGGKK